jgi:hypothetical protein
MLSRYKVPDERLEHLPPGHELDQLVHEHGFLRALRSNRLEDLTHVFPKAQGHGSDFYVGRLRRAILGRQCDLR